MEICIRVAYVGIPEITPGEYNLAKLISTWATSKEGGSIEVYEIYLSREKNTNRFRSTRHESVRARENF